MRLFSLFALAVVLLLALFPSRASAAVTAEFAHADSPRPGQWELLLVRLPTPPEGGTVSVQDARGGLSVSRPLDAATTDALSGESRILLPLPYLAVADLPPQSWPVNISFHSVGGVTDRRRIEIRRPSPVAGTSAGQMPLRIARANASQERAEIADRWDHLNAAPPLFLSLNEDEILTGPPLLFASCDAVLLSDRLVSHITPDRIAALLNGGLQLVSRKPPAAIDNPVLSRLSWQQVALPDATPALWITGRSSYPRPRVLEPGLSRVRTLNAPAAPDRRQIAAIMLVPVAALIVLLLARGLFHRAALILLAGTIGLAAVGLAAILTLRSSDVPVRHTTTWTSSEISPAATQPNTAALSITETFTTSSALFGQHVRVMAESNNFLFPITDSVRQYFAMEDATLALEVLSDDGLRRDSRLDLTLRPRATTAFALRSAAILPADTGAAQGEWIEGGYITPTTLKASDQSGGAPTLLPQWAGLHPQFSDALLTWYELRFVANHRYFLQQRQETDSLTFMDFGPTTSITPPP